MAHVSQETGGSAIPFIMIDEKQGSFEVTSQAMVFLESIPRNVKVSVVAIAGPYRTGKSFLANRLLNQSQGFEIGSTTQACTKGIWIWNKPVQISPDQVMLLMDTEGLSSTERSTNIDIKIFAISILLSSMFIYNQMGPITENSLEDISLVANLTNYIHITQSKTENGSEFRQYFPGFNWVLRDFYHDLEGQTPKQYLEECLQPIPGLSQEVFKKNQIRESFTKYFKDRECFTLIRPVSDESKLAHIEQLPYDSLKSEFRKEVNNLVKQVKKKLKPKMIGGKLITASMFLSLALEYTESMNSNETPTVLTALDRVIQSEAVKIQDQIYDKFCQDLNEQINEETMPLPKEDYFKIIKRLLRQSKLHLETALAPVLNFAEITAETKKFNKRIQDRIDQAYQLNYSASYHFAVRLLNRMLEDLEVPFKDSQQLDEVFIHDYIHKWVTLLREYKQNSNSLIAYEVFAESLVKAPEQKLHFIDKTLIDFEAIAGEASAMEEENEMSSKTSLSNRPITDNYILDIYEQVVEQMNTLMTDQLNKLKTALNDGQTAERKLTQKKKQNDQLIELERTGNEEVVAVKHDFELKIENLKREIVSRKQELDSLKQVKELEIKNLKKNQERQLKDKEEDIKQLEQHKQVCEQTLNSTQAKVQDLDSEKRKEMSSVQNEIKKLEEDIEGLKNKMKSKENNPHFKQVNQFFAEVKDYIEQYKQCFSAVDDSKTKKVKLFDLQKQLNDADYTASQNELKMKKALDEELRKKKEAMEQEMLKQMAELDSERNKIQTLQEKKQVYQSQLEQTINQIGDARERQMNLTEAKEKVVRQQQIKEKRIQELKKDIIGMQDGQSALEERIYTLSIENKNKSDDKDMLLMLLPQVYKAMQGRQNNIKGYLSQMENEASKARLIKLLQIYKISYK